MSRWSPDLIPEANGALRQAPIMTRKLTVMALDLAANHLAHVNRKKAPWSP